MTKYHVKFTHRYRIPQNVNNQTSIEYVTLQVDEEWELEDWANVFSYIYSRFNVIGSVTVTTVIESTKEKVE